VLSKLLTGVTGALGVAAAFSLLASSAIAMPAKASADNDPPPLPNVNSFPPISPVDFSVMNGTWYAFGAPGGLTCVIDRSNNAYGCSGPIPAAPDGATMVSGMGQEQPTFANTSAPVFAAAGPVKPLPPQSRLSYRNVACAIDGGGATVCVNTATQHGFVLSPAGSFTA
jgi:hypothetical protein